MQKSKTAAAFALFLFLAAATPSFAVVNHDHGQDPGGAPTPIQRIMQVVKRIVKSLDTIIIPRP